MKSIGDLPIASRNTANNSAAINSANAGIATYSEFARSRNAKSEPAAGAVGGFTAAATAERSPAAGEPVLMASSLR